MSLERRSSEVYEKIEDFKHYINKIDGYKLWENIGNRIYGILGLGIAAMATSASFYYLPITIPFAIEMIGDIVTGTHHFVSGELFKIHPKYEAEKFMKKKYQEWNL